MKDKKSLPALDPKPPKTKAKPPGPTKRQDAQDIERADSEGMGQPQDLPRKKRKK